MILCTFPGRFGDILWALPTVRAIQAVTGAEIVLAVSGKYGGIVPLLAQQPYVQAATALLSWEVQETAPMTPRIPPVLGAHAYGFDEVYHLGYRGWPQGTLAGDIYERAQRESARILAPLDLDRPWIAVPRTVWPQAPVILGWSEEHFELKVGLSVLLAKRFPNTAFWWIRPWGGRYDEADQGDRGWPANLHLVRADWVTTAKYYTNALCYLGCLSAGWVLANAIGLPTVIVEPNRDRDQAVFWRESPKNTFVRGNDGLNTFDARHAGDALAAALDVAGIEQAPLPVGTRGVDIERGEGE